MSTAPAAAAGAAADESAAAAAAPDIPTGTDSPWVVDSAHAASFFRASVKRRSFTMLIAFRGQFCRYCRAYAEDVARQLETVRRDGGDIILLTSENLERTQRLSRDWGLAEDRLPVISDASNELASSVGFYVDTHHHAVSKKRFPHGMVQPGVLVVDRSGKKLYMWRSHPNFANFGGATGRPQPGLVTQAAERQLSEGNGDSNGEEGGDRGGDNVKPVKMKYTGVMAAFRCC